MYVTDQSVACHARIRLAARTASEVCLENESIDLWRMRYTDVWCWSAMLSRVADFVIHPRWAADNARRECFTISSLRENYKAFVPLDIIQRVNLSN